MQSRLGLGETESREHVGPNLGCVTPKSWYRTTGWAPELGLRKNLREKKHFRSALADLSQKAIRGHCLLNMTSNPTGSRHDTLP